MLTLSGPKSTPASDEGGIKDERDARLPPPLRGHGPHSTQMKAVVSSCWHETRPPKLNWARARQRVPVAPPVGEGRVHHRLRLLIRHAEGWRVLPH